MCHCEAALFAAEAITTPVGRLLQRAKNALLAMTVPENDKVLCPAQGGESGE
jgi:hypothetical protein